MRQFLGAKSSRQHRFDFLTGDPGKDGKRTRLPVDAYYADLNLVIEYRERHHTEEIPIFDNPSVLTVSGVPRGMQRKQYDQRRRDLLPAHGIALVELEYADFEITKNKSVNGGAKRDHGGGVKRDQRRLRACPGSPWEGPARDAACPSKG